MKIVLYCFFVFLFTCLQAQKSIQVTEHQLDKSIEQSLLDNGVGEEKLVILNDDNLHALSHVNLIAKNGVHIAFDVENNLLWQRYISPALPHTNAVDYCSDHKMNTYTFYDHATKIGLQKITKTGELTEVVYKKKVIQDRLKKFDYLWMFLDEEGLIQLVSYHKDKKSDAYEYYITSFDANLNFIRKEPFYLPPCDYNEVTGRYHHWKILERTEDKIYFVQHYFNKGIEKKDTLSKAEQLLSIHQEEIDLYVNRVVEYNIKSNQFSPPLMYSISLKDDDYIDLVTLPTLKLDVENLSYYLVYYYESNPHYFYNGLGIVKFDFDSQQLLYNHKHDLVNFTLDHKIPFSGSFPRRGLFQTEYVLLNLDLSFDYKYLSVDARKGFKRKDHRYNNYWIIDTEDGQIARVEQSRLVDQKVLKTSQNDLLIQSINCYYGKDIPYNGAHEIRSIYLSNKKNYNHVAFSKNNAHNRFIALLKSTNRQLTLFTLEIEEEE